MPPYDHIYGLNNTVTNSPLRGLVKTPSQRMSLAAQVITVRYLIFGGGGGSRDSNQGGSGSAGQCFEGTISLVLGKTYQLIAGGSGGGAWSGGYGGAGGTSQLIDWNGNVLLNAAGGAGANGTIWGAGVGGPANGSSGAGGPGYCTDIEGHFYEYCQGASASGVSSLMSWKGTQMGAPNASGAPAIAFRGTSSNQSTGTGVYSGATGCVFLRYPGPNRLTVISSNSLGGGSGVYGTQTVNPADRPDQTLHRFTSYDSTAVESGSSSNFQYYIQFN